MVEAGRRHVSVKGAAFTLTVAILALSTFSFIPAGSPAASASSPSSPYSWNPKIPCTPLVVRIEDITANQTGSASFSASPFSPGTTPPVSGGDSKRWLTPGTTPQGWIAPGPSCTVTNSKGTTSLFVEIDGLQRTSLTNEDWSNLYDPSNGGTFHSTLTGDTTLNLFDPKVVPNYSISCTSPSDPTCYGRIHGEIDHDWKAAGYCGPGTACDNATLASQTSSASTLIDVQGFIYWDAGAVAADWHQFNGWEIHPLTAWKLDNSPPPVPFGVSASPANPQVGQPVIFTATPQNGTTPAAFSWNFGDGVTAAGSSASHIFVTAQTFTVYATMTGTDGASFTTWIVVPVGSWNQSVACSPAGTTLEGVIGSVSTDRTPSNSSTAGADYSGGGFRLDGNLPYGSNPLTWPFFRRDLRPPCSVNGTSAFVEFHNVTVINLSKDNCGTTYQNGTSYPNGWQSCDTTFSLATPGFGDDSCPACYMHRIYAGIDRDWNASGIAPMPPKEGQRIDVQGFVFWNDANVNATWHSYSGWEIHPISSWRLTHLPIVAGVTFSPSNPTSAQTVTFNATASGGTGPYTFNWDFGDGTIAAGSTTSHTYATGTYTVHVSATDSLGAVGTASQNITVRIPPDFTLSVNPSSVAFPAGSSVSVGVNVSSLHAFNGNVSLTAITSTGIAGSFNQTSVALVPGDSAGSTLTFSSLTPGTYTVTVTGSSDLISHSANVTVTVVDVGPTVGFSESTNTAFRDDTITMTISTSDIDGTVTRLSVSWGDGTTDSLPGNAVTDSHVYVTSGTFTVNVTATDNAGLSTSATNANRITDAPPTARFTQSATTAPTGTAISFDGTTSSDRDGTIVSYDWDFGDGSTANGVNVSHSYGLAGNYTVTLTVTDNATLTGSTSSVTRITDRPPVVSLALSSTSSPTGMSLTLTINATDPDGALTGIIVSWGDGATDTLPGNMTSDSHAYTLAGSYAIHVNATDDAGLTTSSSSSIIITDRPPVVSFTESANNAPTGTPITLMINATDPDGFLTGVTVNWGDGAIDSLPGTATTDNHAYPLAGSYTITISGIDDAGLTGSYQSTTTIRDRPPSVVFTETTTTVPTGTPVTLTISASDPDGVVSRISVSWGDGTVDTLPGNATSDSHAYSLAGSYSAYVNATDNAGLSSRSDTMVVRVTDRPPVVSFTESSTTVSTGSTITLTISASDPDGSVTSIKVSWGDGTVDSLPGNATSDGHSYSLAGTYNVYVNATDDASLTGQSSVATLTITDRPPVVTFTESASTTFRDQTVTINISSADPDGTVVSLRVNWGDGSIDTLPGSSTMDAHAYVTASVFKVNVTAMDDAGLSTSVTAVNTVNDAPPTAGFTQSLTAAQTGTSISFDGSASSDPDGTIVSYAWDFGDGSTSSGVNPSHSYSLAGSYTVRLTATDNATLTASTSAVVQILDSPPLVSFNSSTPTAPTGTSIALAINATDHDGSVASIIVSWGDGTVDILPGNATSDNHAYNLAGSYTVYVNATDNAGLTTVSGTITESISDRPPAVSLSEPATTAPTGTPITLTINATDPDGTVVAIQVAWGDGTTDNLTGNATADTHSYALAGSYTVSVTATDNAALTGNAQEILTINDRPPAITFTESATTVPTGTAITLTISANDPDGSVNLISVSWGDGTIDVLPGNATSDGHSYALAGHYSVYVNATDNAGLVTTSSVASLTVTDRPPMVSFTGSTSNTPTGTPVILTINATDPDGSVRSIVVVWGDGVLDNVQGNATVDAHSYTLAGSYTVYMNATDDFGLTTMSGMTVLTITDRPPAINFTESPTTAPTGTQISITINATDADGAVTGITVNWGDGTIDSLPGNATSDSHSFSIAGLYSVHVNVTDDAGLTTSRAASLTITDRPPAVTFTQSAASAFRDQTVTLTVSSSDPDGAVTSLRIDWGDGTVDVLPGDSTTDSHAYITAGIFTLNITASDDAGLSTSATGLETIADVPPVAAFTQSQSTVSTGAPISFDSSTSSDSDGTIVSYSWDFGDGSTASGTIVSHSYRFAGNYTVTLMVTDNATLTASTTTLVRVLDRPATVSITASTTNSPTGSPITLTLNATDPDGSITSLIVSWGDGTTNALPGNATSVSHAYSLAGSYTVYVNATDDVGLTATSPTVIESISNRPPVVSLGLSAQTVPTGTSITLTINATDPDGFVTGITVNWGDGAIDSLTGNATADTHSYILAGSYTATVTAIDDAGLTGNSQSAMTITDRPPVVAFTGSASTVSTRTVVTLTINATDPDGTISTLIVSWGDGTVDNLLGSATSDSHSYSISGNYSVYVNATDNANLTSQSSMASLTITDRLPTISLNESTSTAFRDQTLTLTISASDPDGSVTSLRVDWGDGTIDIMPGTSTTDTHAYVLAGTFTINATATDNNGLSTSATTVNSIVDAPPTVSLTTSPGSANTGQSVTLTISSQDSDGTITQTVVDWGDGTSDSFSGAATTDTHAYAGTGSAKSQTFTVSVTVTDNATLTATSNTLVTINDLPPTASFTSSTASALTAESISFNATATNDPDGNITSYSWDFGDGSTATGIVVSHSYANTGNSASQAFTVTLTATDNSGNTATTAFVEMISDRNPVAAFTPSAQTTLTGTSVTFNATASTDLDGSVLTYSWSFGDGNTGTGAIVTHAYTSTGNALSQVFTVSLTITDNSGNTGNASAIVTVNDRPPAASFTQSTSSTPTGVSVGFNASSSIDPDGTILSYAWNFGDGNTGTGVIVNHSYASTGNSLSQTFTVTLTITDNSGNSGTVSGSVTVTDRPPIATFASTQPVTQTLTSITFVATGSSDPDGTITSYSWTFGDGGTALGPIVTYSYSTTGNSMVANYTVTLTVRDNSGRTATTQSIQTISDRPPTASFNESASSTTTGSTITFNASASSDPDGTVSTYSWTFGDGGTATGSTVTHSYASTGNAQTATFTVTLTVADNGGDTGSSSTAETISDRPPTASFTTSPTSPLTGTGVTFNATASNDPDGSIVDYAWNFGDGSTGSGMAVSHGFTVAGAYVVSLTVADNTGNTATSIGPFTVQDRPPIAAFSFNPANPHQAQTIGFNATSSSDQDGTVTSYAWDFGDGSPAGSGSTTSHIYSVDGNYTVTLTVTDNSGSTGTAITRVTVRLDKPPSWGSDGSLTIQEIQESANGTSLSLSWTPATDDGAISLYLIYVNGALRATVGATVTQYTLSGLAPGSYQLRVEAVDDAGLASTNALTMTVEVGGSGGSRYAS